MSDNLLGRLILGRYRIVRRLAKGGMGTIYLARQEGAAGFAKPVVVKRILPGALDDDTAVRLFQREARIMAHLRHPGIVDVIEFSEDDDGYTMVLDYVHGYHLAKWCYFVRKTRGPLAVDVAVQIIIQVLDALHYAHTLKGPDGELLGIVHRDIKPSNVLIDVSGHVKLLDFGIAQMVDDRTVADGADAAVRGTFPYMAPELFRHHEPSAATDAYACGVVLHEAIAGKNELRNKDMTLTVARVLHHVPSRLDVLRKDVPTAIADVVERALAKDPNDRYADAGALADALRAARDVSADEAAALLATQAERDFRDPQFAKLLKTADLAALDRAWREDPVDGEGDAEPLIDTPPPLHTPPSAPADVVPDPAENAPPAAGDATRVMSEHKPAPAPVEQGRGRRGWIFGLVVLAAVAIGGGAVAIAMMFSRGDDKPAVQFIHVSGDVRAEGSTTAPGDSPPATASTDAPTAVTPPSQTEKHASPRADSPAKKVPLSTRLSRAFARQEPRLDRCFNANAEKIVGAPKLVVRFRIGKSGRVISAKLEPATVAATSLGECLLRVAKATDFPAPGRALSFSIPIASVQR